MTGTEYDAIVGRLRALADPVYREFHSRLVPGTQGILGVRLPALRTLARELARGDWAGFLAAARADSYEEIMLQGLVIGYVRAPAPALFAALTNFVPLIDNWAVCDCVCAGLKFFAKCPDEAWEFLRGYTTSEREFDVRFGVVGMMDYFIDERHLEELIVLLGGLGEREYYVQMGVAWAVSVCYVKFPERVEQWLADCPLDRVTFHRALQKIVESRRVDAAGKARIRALRRA